MKDLHCSMTVHSDASVTSTFSSNPSKESERIVFQKARHYLNPGAYFRLTTYLYAERKLVIFFLVHFICTMIVWSHFALNKFTVQAESVPDGAPRYWWKRLAPPLEFGSMHAILFQMTLIPLTMARYSIAALSDSFLHRFIPLNRSMRIHIHLGYTMVGIVFLATTFFFAFFGLLCSDGDQKFCKKFTDEIMITGYVILAFLLTIGGTSFFRHSIPYEWFYGIHHVVFLLYFLTIAHTLDVEQRTNQSERSQTFKWFSSTLLFYFCDRAAMHLNQKYKARLVSSSVVNGSKGSKMIILRLRRPALFQFKPGQYAYLRLNDIDVHWHPFSIASGPASSYLEFYIEVFGETSWTCKLWNILQEANEDSFSARQINFEMMGPYGTCLAKTDDYSHALAIGAGTGIVPILSLFKQHVHQLIRNDPEKYLQALEEHQKKMVEVDCAQEQRKGSIAKKIAAPCLERRGRDASRGTRSERLAASFRKSVNRHQELRRWEDVRGNMNHIKRAAFEATRSIYGVVLLTIMPAFGVALIGLTISWNTVDFELRYGMVESVEVFTVFFQLLFAMVALYIWEGNTIFAYLDAALTLVSPFADWYWFKKYAEVGLLNGAEVFLYGLLIGYMTARLWSKEVQPQHNSWRNTIAEDGFNALDRMEMIWVTRSASLVSEIMPDICGTWDALVKAWGKENALKVCRVAVHITDKDEEECEVLKKELRSSDLFQSGAVSFGRPDFGEIIEDHTLEMICTRSKSASILAFCGSPQLAREIHHEKISNDMLVTITGNQHHQMEYIAESYGGVKSTKKKTTTKESSPSPSQTSNEDEADEEIPSSSSSRRNSARLSAYLLKNSSSSPRSPNTRSRGKLSKRTHIKFSPHSSMLLQDVDEISFASA